MYTVRILVYEASLVSVTDFAWIVINVIALHPQMFWQRRQLEHLDLVQVILH
jgi:hypothetical protein